MGQWKGNVIFSLKKAFSLPSPSPGMALSIPERPVQTSKQSGHQPCAPTRKKARMLFVKKVFPLSSFPSVTTGP